MALVKIVGILWSNKVMGNSVDLIYVMREKYRWLMEHAKNVLNMRGHKVQVRNVVVITVKIGKNYYPPEFVKIVQNMKNSKEMEQPVGQIHVTPDKEYKHTEHA